MSAVTCVIKRCKARVFILVLAAVLSGGIAFAFFTSVGTGTASITTGGLDAPVAPTAAANGTGKVDIAWSRAFVSATTTPAEHYVVKRYSGSPAFSTFDGFACGTGVTPIADSAGGMSGSFSCTDSGLTSAGPYKYTVTSVYRSWTAESGLSNQVTVSLIGPLDHFTLSAATTTPTAGQANNLTITAKDAANNTISTYTGGKSLTFSGAADAPDGTHPSVVDTSGTARSFGTATTITFSNGTATVSGATNGVMRLFKVETASIVASDGSVSSAGLSVTVAPAAAASLSVSGYPSSTVAGVSNTFLVAARDAFGNTATGYAGTVALSASNDAAAVLPSNSTLTSGTGTFSATFKTVAGGTKTLTATDTLTSAITGSESGITVTPAAAASLSVSGYPSSTVAGVSNTFMVAARDAFGNTATGYAGTVAFSASNDAAAVLPSNSTLTSGTGTFSATFKTVAGGTKTLTATDTLTSAITGSESGITVTPAPASTIAVSSGSGQTATVSTAFSNPLVALVRDAFGNPASGVSVTFAGPPSGAGGTFTSSGCTSNTPTSQCVATTGANGQATSSAFTANSTAGTYNVSASASGTNTVNFSLTNAALDTFQVTVSSPQTAGASFNATITAKTGASTDTSYTGSKCILFTGPTSSPNATQPTYPAQGSCAAGLSSVTFSAGVASTVPITLVRAVASTTLTAADGAITGSSSPIAVNSAAVALSYDKTCPLAVAKNSTTAFTINVPNDAYGNAFTRTTALGIGLSLSGTNATSFSFGAGTATTTVSITTGPANNTFSLNVTGANKSAAIVATGASGFTAPASCTVNAGN